MDDLASWLTFQLDEDTRTASSWHTLDCDIHAHLEGDADSVQATMAMFHQAPGLVCDCGGPARMLREIDADRALLAEYGRLLDAHASHQQEAVRLAEAGADADAFQLAALRREADYLPAMVHVLEVWARRKAAVHADRPGYLESWRP